MSAFEDGMVAPLRAAAYVQGQGEAGRARGEDKRRRSLAAAYFSGGVDPEQTGRFLGDVAQAGGDPIAFQREAFSRAGQHAAMLVDAPDALKPQAYAQLAREMHGLGYQVPLQYDPQALPMIAKFAQQHGGATAGGARVQSTRIDDQGNTIAIMSDGSTQTLFKAAPTNKIIDTGDGYSGVDTRSLIARPVVVGQPDAPVPVPAAPPPPEGSGLDDRYAATAQFMERHGVPADEVAAWLAEQPGMVAAGEGGSGGAAVAAPQQLRSVPKPAPEKVTTRVLSAREVSSLGLPAGTIAQQDSTGKVDVVSQPPKPAKNEAQIQAAMRRNQSAVDTAQATIDTIDRLVTSPGYKSLGTISGDIASRVPLVRTDAKDSQAQLDVLGGQIALSTMSSLKALSAQGATGFGALNRAELTLLQNAVASLQAGNLSHEQLDSNIKVVREKMDKIAQAGKDAIDGVDAAGGAKEITSQAQYDSLPSGAVYLEDGKQYRKP